MSKLTQSILAKIKEEKITPRAKAWFQTKNALVWGLAVIALILCGVLLASLMRELLEAEWEVASRWPGGGFRFIQEAISLISLVGIFAAFVIGFVFFRHTKRGYRYGVFMVGGVILVASLVLAFSLIPTEIPEKLRDFRENQLGIQPFDETPWKNPEAGFLIGTIQQSEDTLLILNALDNTIWQVGIGDADIAPMVKLQVGEEIRALGEKTGKDTFEADVILPRQPMRMMHNMMHIMLLPGGISTQDSIERNSNSPAYQMMQAR
jgi:hypothetical protein